MYKAVIFDLDGTLTDTLDSLEFSVNETMKETGLAPITREQCRKFVGNGAKVLIERALQASGDEQLKCFDRAYCAYQRIFDQNCTYLVRPYPGVEKMLACMKDAGMKLAVLSNKPDRQTVHVVEDIFEKGLFDVVHGQREGIPRKPDPASLLSMASELGADSSEILYIGDSEVDLATGRGAGVDTILVSWGFRSRQELKEAGAERIADTAGEIIQMMQSGGNENE